MAQTTEERIAQIAQGFGQGFQNFQGQQDRQRAQALQEEALKRQRALQSLEVANQMSAQTGRVIDPSMVAPMLTTGDFSGIGELMKAAPLTRKAEQEQLERQRQLKRDEKQEQVWDSQIKKNLRNPTDKFKQDEEKRKFQAIDTLRKEITSLPATKDLVNIDTALSKIKSAPQNAAGDMSKIFAYMKILDPNSTVREGEYASAEQARGVPSAVLGSYNKVLKGERLTPAQRKEFEQAAENLARSQFQTYKSVISPQMRRIQELSLDSSQILPQFSQQAIFDGQMNPTGPAAPIQNARITDQIPQNISPQVIQRVQSYTPEQAEARKQELLRKAGV